MVLLAANHLTQKLSNAAGEIWHFEPDSWESYISPTKNIQHYANVRSFGAALALRCWLEFGSDLVGWSLLIFSIVFEQHLIRLCNIFIQKTRSKHYQYIVPSVTKISTTVLTANPALRPLPCSEQLRWDIFQCAVTVTLSTLWEFSTRGWRDWSLSVESQINCRSPFLAQLAAWPNLISAHTADEYGCLGCTYPAGLFANGKASDCLGSRNTTTAAIPTRKAEFWIIVKANAMGLAPTLFDLKWRSSRPISSDARLRATYDACASEP
jgi:hypothetical protein